MSISSDSSTTTLETRLLAALTEPMTSTDVFDELSINYPYGIKVLRKMRKKNLVGTIQRGNKTLYYTIRTPGTEMIFAARAKAKGKTEWLIPFTGELITLGEAAKKLHNKRVNFQSKDVYDWAGRILYNLRWNSCRKSKNLPTQRPYAEDMRLVLERRLALARFEIAFVEEMLKAPIWNDSENVWSIISAEEPDMEQGKINSEELGKRIYKA